MSYCSTENTAHWLSGWSSPLFRSAATSIPSIPLRLHFWSVTNTCDRWSRAKHAGMCVDVCGKRRVIHPWLSRPACLLRAPSWWASFFRFFWQQRLCSCGCLCVTACLFLRRQVIYDYLQEPIPLSEPIASHSRHANTSISARVKVRSRGPNTAPWVIISSP